MSQQNEVIFDLLFPLVSSFFRPSHFLFIYLSGEESKDGQHAKTFSSTNTIWGPCLQGLAPSSRETLGVWTTVFPSCFKVSLHCMEMYVSRV